MGAGLSRPGGESKKPLGKESVIVTSQGSSLSRFDSQELTVYCSSCEHACSHARTLPVCNGWCCAIGAAAAVVGILRKPDMDGTLHMLSSGSKRFDLVAKGLTWYYIGVLLIIFMSFLAGIISCRAGRARDDIEESFERQRCSLRLIYIRLVQVLLLFLYILQLLMSYTFLIVLVLVVILDTVCESGEAAVSKLLELSPLLRDVHYIGVSDVFEQARRFSEIDKDVLTAALYMFAASALIATSLGPLLACVTYTKEHTHGHLHKESALLDLESFYLTPRVTCQSTQTDGKWPQAMEVKDIACQTGPDQLQQEVNDLKERLALKTALLDETQQKLEKAEYKLARQILETAEERRRTTKAEGELESMMRMHSRAQQHLHKWRESATSSSSSTAPEETKAATSLATDRLDRFSPAKVRTPNVSNAGRYAKLDESQASTSSATSADRLARFSLTKVRAKRSGHDQEASANAQPGAASRLEDAEAQAQEELSMLFKKPKAAVKRTSDRGFARRSRQSKSTTADADSKDVLDPPPTVAAPPPLPPPSKGPQPSDGGSSQPDGEALDAKSFEAKAPAAPWETHLT